MHVSFGFFHGLRLNGRNPFCPSDRSTGIPFHSRSSFVAYSSFLHAWLDMFALRAFILSYGKGGISIAKHPRSSSEKPQCGRATVGHNWAMGSFLECACFHFQEKRRACAHLQCLQQRVRISFQKWYLPLTLPSAARAIDNGRDVVRVPSGWSF